MQPVRGAAVKSGMGPHARPWLLLVGALVCATSVSPAQPLPERRTLAIHVSLPDGKPAARVELDIRRADLRSVAASWGEALCTDLDGNVSIPAMEDGLYLLRIRDGKFVLLKPYLALDSDHDRWNLALSVAPKLTIRLLDPEGKPIKNRAVVYNYVSNGTGTQGTQSTDAEGSLTLRSADGGGIYLLHLSISGLGTATRHFKAMPGTDPLTIQLQAVGSLKIEVTKPTGQGAPVADSFEVELRYPKENGAQDNGVNYQTGVASFSPRGTGSMQLADLITGSYEVKIELVTAGAAQPWAEKQVTIEAGRTTDVRF